MAGEKNIPLDMEAYARASKNKTQKVDELRQGALEMTPDQAKDQIDRLERQKGTALWKDELLLLLRPISAGTHVIISTSDLIKLRRDQKTVASNEYTDSEQTPKDEEKFRAAIKVFNNAMAYLTASQKQD